MIFKKIIRLADFITVISKYLEDVIMRNGVMREKISIIPNGVDINKFSSNPNYGEILKLKDELARILAKHTGQSLDRIEKDSDRDFFMSAGEAKAYGLVDEVIESRSDVPGGKK